MRRWFDQLFGFSRKELQGILVLLLVLVLSWVAPALYRWLVPPARTDMAFYEKEISSFLASAELVKQTYKSRYADSTVRQNMATRNAVRTAEYFLFNPNQMSSSDWERLGLSDRQINNLKNYQAKGGIFRQKGDLKKIYTITEADFSRLEPYIQIPGKITTHPADTAQWQPKPKNIPIMELNAVDSLSLQVLPGIGPVFASRIVRFRDRLGGFYDLSQLLHIYGMDNLRYAGIKDHLTVNSSLIKKIDINEATYEELNVHPLISPKQANAIVQYRNQHGPYQQLQDLLNIVVIDPEFMEQAAPYLKK